MIIFWLKHTLVNIVILDGNLTDNNIFLDCRQSAMYIASINLMSQTTYFLFVSVHANVGGTLTVSW